jgi:RNA polymerase sigma factor (sigma-70 family)
MTPISVQTDAEMIEQFLTGKLEEAESAFEAIMARHGPMVMGVCRQTTNQRQDAEDAFQATFLTLARKAATIRCRLVLGPWLHSVAFRIAVRMRTQAVRQHAEILSGDELSPKQNGDGERGELQAIVHAELNRLPDKYRIPAVWYYLEGKTCKEAAELLGRPVGTIKGQLSRARGLLRRRLNRRYGHDFDQRAVGATLAFKRD